MILNDQTKNLNYIKTKKYICKETNNLINKMIIPIRCFTCGKVLADKWKYYKEKADAIDAEYHDFIMKENAKVYDRNVNDDVNYSSKFEESETLKPKTYKNIEKTYKKEILNELGLNKLCCRRHMIGHVDMMGKI